MTAEAADPTSLADIAVRRARRDASTPIVLTLDEEHQHAVDVVTYGAALDRAMVLVRALVDAGVAPGDRVGCYLPNSPSWVVASLAVWFAGGAVAAAGTLLPPVEAAALFALADAKVVVTTSDTAELDGDFTVLRIDDRGLLADAPDPVANAWEDADLRPPEPDDLAVAIFTSGTTGRPKGITHTHGDIVTPRAEWPRATRATATTDPTRRRRTSRPACSSTRSGTWPATAALAFRMWIGRPDA